MRFFSRNAAPERVSKWDCILCFGVPLICLKVPVIAIFTKVDAMVTTAFNILHEKDGKSRKDAKQAAPELASNNLNAIIDLVFAMKYQPKRHVCLSGRFG
jgi:hypothetical protein